MMQEHVLRAEKLAVGYGEKIIVEGIDFTANCGEILCLIGPNGAGKSTILKTLIRQLRPLQGTVLLEGRPLDELTEKELAQKSAAVLTGRIDPELMSCEEVVAAGRYPYTGRLGILSPRDWACVEEAIHTVQIEDIRDKLFSDISDGQRQRVMLARALCQEPELLIMDEPTSFLDIRHKLEFMSLLRTLVRERGLAVVLSLHELELAEKFCDRILCIRDGAIQAAGTPDEIFTDERIRTLYGMEEGSFLSLFGTMEAKKITAPPRAFVIGGGGSGIPVYRYLQRQGIPFAAGVLPANDMDVPVAKALASVLILDRENEAISEARVEEALAVMKTCDEVLCTVKSFGAVNHANRKLLIYAKEHGLLCGECKV